MLRRDKMLQQFKNTFDAYETIICINDAGAIRAGLKIAG
jgi:hypothetical protein